VSTGLVVASGKVTASPEQLRRALHNHVRTLERKAPHADRYGILVTEASPDKYNDPLHEFAQEHRWWMFHPLGMPGADECAVLSSVPLEDHAAYRLTDLHLTKATTNRTAPIVLTGAKLHDGPWLADWHTPAHNGGLDPKTWPTHVYDSALEGLRVAVHDMGGGDGKTIAADFNVDLARGEIRDRIGKDYPHMHWSWHPGQKPTEGGRVIDGFLTNLPIKQAAVTLPLEHGFDHHAVFAELGEKRAA
jgi:hypothetical protein